MEDVIRKYFQCWLDKDINDVKEIFSDDIIYSECYGPVYKGIGQIVRWFEDWNRKGTVLQWDIQRVIISGNTAIVEWYLKCDYEGNVACFDGVTIAEFDAYLDYSYVEAREKFAEYISIHGITRSNVDLYIRKYPMSTFKYYYELELDHVLA